MTNDLTQQDDPLTYQIIGIAIAVHKQLGPGLVESVYEEPFWKKLSESGLACRRQPRMPIPFEGSILDREYRPDFIVENQVVIEIKSVKTVLPVHEAQILTYMRLAEIERGLLINFNVALLVHGVKRFILTKYAATEGRHSPPLDD